MRRGGHAGRSGGSVAHAAGLHPLSSCPPASANWCGGRFCFGTAHPTRHRGRRLGFGHVGGRRASCSRGVRARKRARPGHRQGAHSSDCLHCSRASDDGRRRRDARGGGTARRRSRARRVSSGRSAGQPAAEKRNRAAATRSATGTRHQIAYRSVLRLRSLSLRSWPRATPRGSVVVSPGYGPHGPPRRSRAASRSSASP